MSVSNPRDLSPVALLHEHPEHNHVEVVYEADGYVCGHCGNRIEGFGMIERRIEKFTLIENTDD